MAPGPRKPPAGPARPPAGKPAPASDFDDDGPTRADSRAPVTGFGRPPTSGGAPAQRPSGGGSGAHRITSQGQGGGSGSFPVPQQAGFQDRAPRARVTVPVRFRYQSIIDFVDTQSMNVSRSGMFVTCDQPLPAGTSVQFEFALSDGYVLLKGSAEVTRVSHGPGPKGMGLRFVDLEDKSKKLIDRIVEVNMEEGKSPTVPLDFTTRSVAPATVAAPRAGAAPVAAQPAAGKAVAFNGLKLRLVLNPMTAPYFSYNPLLNIKMGGFVVPSDQDVPLGTIYQVEIVDAGQRALFSGSGKVVAKQDKRLGIRLVDADKDVLARLGAEVNKLAPAK